MWLHGLLLGAALTMAFAFFFASVAANAIATVARNPVSGMTMLTIIFSSVVLLRFGLEGPTGMFFVMAIAGMVCTALSVSGQTITDLKTGYWLGSTPAAMAQRPIRTRKIDFLSLPEFDYSRSRLIDDGWGYDYDRVGNLTRLTDADGHYAMLVAPRPGTTPIR